MTLALLILLAAAVSGSAYYFFKEINWQEALIGFGVSILVGVGAYAICIVANQSESMIVTGYVTSKFHRESYRYEEDYTYRCNCKQYPKGGETCDTCHGTHYYTEPERWYLAAGFTKPVNLTSTEYYFNTKGDRLGVFQSRPKEDCFGYCDGQSWSSNISKKDYQVSEDKYNRTSPGTYAAWTEYYSNPLKVSEVLFFKPKGQYEYPSIYDYDQVDRSSGTDKQNSRLNYLNAKLSRSGTGPSIQIRFTNDSLEYEKLVREWHNGRKNDLIIIIAHDRVDVLGWGNFKLRTDLAFGLSSLPDKKLDSILTYLESFKFNGYIQKDFSEYSYLNIEVHWSVWLFIFLLDVTVTVFTYFGFTKNEYGK